MTTKTREPTLPSDIPRDGNCTFMVGNGRMGIVRCSKRATTNVSGYPNRNYKTNELGGEQFEAPCCGTHNRKAQTGGSHLIYAGHRRGEFLSRTLSLYTEATEANKLKGQIERAEWDAKSRRSAANAARTTAGRAMFEQAPEILEMLYMVAERGDQRAWAAINVIRDGMDEVQKADKAYQNLLRKIEALQAQLEEAQAE